MKRTCQEKLNLLNLKLLNLKIISTVISESVFLTALAGLTGMALGVYLVELTNKLLGTPADNTPVVILNPGVDFRVAITAVIVLVLFGILAGIIPAKRAVSIKPIEAIREEN